jgi:uncharacterized cofD-like protein
MLLPPEPTAAARAPEAVVFSRPRIVALGGGTGLPALLRGLREPAAGEPRGARPVEADRDRLTAVVTVADDGGSSGRLRREYGMLAPGDIRNCLLALSQGEGPLAGLFGYRFNGKGEMSGHSLGNLILAALSDMESGFGRAVDAAGALLGVSGRILPATAGPVALDAEFEDGTRVAGESRIARHRGRIRRIRLEPEGARAAAAALDAVAQADCIVIGPGSLYTSLVPVLLAGGLVAAIAASTARVVVVMNLMTEPGETDGYTAREHLVALRAHAPGLPVHDVVVNRAPIPDETRRRYAALGAQPLGPAEDLAGFGCRVHAADLLAGGPHVRHDPGKLAGVVLRLAADAASGRFRS